MKSQLICIYLEVKLCSALRKYTFRIFLPVILQVFLIVTIAKSQCSSTITSFPYQEDFETNNGGWTTGTAVAALSDWTWGHPSKTYINAAGSGQKCWITGGLTGSHYNDGELSWLQTPCFNFSGLVHPFISFKIYWESELHFDGAVLQYSVNSGTSWTNVGSINDAVNCFNSNWYNLAAVTWLKPPLVTVNNGWSGTHTQTGACPSDNGSGGWVTAMHQMNNLAGAPSVVFRFVFGAGTTCNDFDGVAIDNVFIGESPTLPTPNFNAIGPLCQGSVAPSLPGTSTNGVTGTWNPLTISTSNPGTTTYTFTPANGQCATTSTLNITITAPVQPQFAPITPLCQGSVAPALPGVSTNGITGTWSPSTINTSNPGTVVYTFTPNSGQCAGTTALNVTVNAPTQALFAPINTLCQGSVSPSLPTTSINNITGTWNPATISTANLGTQVYTFTPAPGQCANTVTLNITITAPSTVPTFNAIAAICRMATAPALPPISNNGISGTWSPAIISTTAVGTTVYTFTPNSGQCATTASLSLTVNPLPTNVFAGPPHSTTPGVGVTLQGSAPDALTYLWSPASTLSNATILNPVATPIQTTLYKLTATNGFGCTASDTVRVTVITDDCMLDPSRIFTPNNDGYYDLWVVYKGTCSKIVEASVYNRYGSQVYHSANYHNDWDGTYRGKPLPDATYYYVLVITNPSWGFYRLTGNVTIMR